MYTTLVIRSIPGRITSLSEVESHSAGWELSPSRCALPIPFLVGVAALSPSRTTRKWIFKSFLETLADRVSYRGPARELQARFEAGSTASCPRRGNFRERPPSKARDIPGSSTASRKRINCRGTRFEPGSECGLVFSTGKTSRGRPRAPLPEIALPLADVLATAFDFVSFLTVPTEIRKAQDSGTVFVPAIFLSHLFRLRSRGPSPRSSACNVLPAFVPAARPHRNLFDYLRRDGAARKTERRLF